MPDFTNEGLMKLILRVIKKVDTIEAKLDILLDERPPKIEKLKTVDHGFSFTTIANDKELQLVTKKILQEANYKENLRNFIENQKRFTLEDIFKPEYLKFYSYYGVKGMKKLEGLVVYEQIYVYLKSLQGLPLRDIRLKAMRDIGRVKKRFFERNARKRNNQALALVKKGENLLYSVDMEKEPPCKIQKIEESVSVDSDLDDLYEDKTKTKPEEVFIEESVYEEFDHEDKDDDETDDDQNAGRNQALSFVENERQPPCKILRVEENVSMDSDFDDLETESEEVFVEESVYEEFEHEDKDEVVERSERPPKVKKLNIELGFHFTPIASDKELKLVTQKIQQEANYKDNLRKFIERQKGFTLEDIFMADYLKHFSYYGVQGMKKMEGLVVYEEIYVYLKSLDGVPTCDIKMMAKREIKRIKQRFMARNRNERPRQALSLVENSANPDYGEIENQEESPCKIQKVEGNVSMDSDEEDLNEDKTETEPGQVVIEVYQEIDHEDKNDDKMDDDGLNFRPIKNDEELENVTQKMQSNPDYLKDLRIQIVDETEDGQCLLTHVFSERFLADCTVYGMRNNKKLKTMVPYKEVYFYLKSHFGLSLKDIEKEAMDELERVKKRVGRLRAKEALKHQTT